MNRELIALELSKWMTEFVEQPHPALNNWPPCPYARQARVSNKMEIVFASDDLLASIEQSLPKLENKDVVVICFDHNLIDANQLESMIGAYNTDSLMPRNYVVLEDHPNKPEILNGVTMNFGHCGLLLLSRLDVLNDASVQLRSKGYYDHWPKENLDYVVNWRFK